MTLTSPRDGSVTVFPTPGTLAEGVADWLIAELSGRERAAVCLSGGSTPKRLYERLASPGHVERFPWERVHWFWGDERFVPPDDPDSNYGMTRAAMLDAAPVPPQNIHSIPTLGVTPETAAETYQEHLRRFYGAQTLSPAAPLFDVMLLGLGPDGHTASLIPGQPVLEDRSRWVAPVPHGRPEVRITLTYPVLESARLLAFLVAGADKAAIVSDMLAGRSDAPAARLRSGGRFLWFLDRAARGDASATPA